MSLRPGRTVVTVGKFTDRTRAASVGGREMIEAAVRNTSRASNRWGVRRYDFVADTVGLQGAALIPPNVLKRGEDPGVVILGSVTQLDQGVELAGNGGSLIFGDLVGVGVQQNEQASVLGIDLQAFNAANGDLIAQSSNTITLQNKQQAANARGSVQKFGITAEISLERQDGIGAASRALIDLGVIELLGELSGVPYWECLSAPSTNPEVRVLIQRWWRSLDATAQRNYVQSRLINLGYLKAGAPVGAFAPALARYEAAVGLTPDGRPDRQVYAALLHTKPSDQLAAASFSDLAPLPAAPATPSPSAPQPNPSPMAMLTRYAPDTGLQIDMKIYRRGYVQCFLKLQTGEVVQFYPNPFQPASFLSLGEYAIPRSSQDFQIKLDDHPEDMAGICAHSGRPVAGDLPSAMQQRPFVPLKGQSLQNVVDAINRANSGAYTSQFRLPASLRQG